MNWSVSASSTSTSNAAASSICNIVSEAQGVNPARNVACIRTTTTARRLQTATQTLTNTYVYSATLAASHDSPVTTASLTTLSAEKQTELFASIVTTLGSTFTASGYASSAYTATQQTVGWSKEPSVSDTTSSSVTIALTSTNLYGEIACVVLNKQTQTEYDTINKYKPSATQVYLGIDADN